jgi:uncharacterized membrane protein
MPEYRTTGWVDAPPAVVWKVLIDVEAMPEWTTSMSRVEILGGAPLDEGSRVKIRQPKLLPAVWTIEQWRPPYSFSWTSRQPGSRIVASHLIEPDGRGTRVTLSIEMQGSTAGLLWRLTKGRSRAYVDAELAGLVARAEELHRRAQR